MWHVDQHGLQGIVTVSYKTYRNTYQISRYVSLVEKVYRYTPTGNNVFYYFHISAGARGTDHPPFSNFLFTN